MRIALNMKGVHVTSVPVNLREGAQGHADFLDKNPQGYLPALELDDGTILTQSLAILDYLDATYSEPALMPREALLRSKILSAALTISADIHPVQNLSVLKYLRAEFNADDAAVTRWSCHWIEKGFASLEGQASPKTKFYITDTPMFFETCLIPQIYNARRFGVDMTQFPRLSAIEAQCAKIDAFEAARPENQSDAF